MTKVSVVVPCYNVEKYVSKCLQTLCNQTLQDIEIICVDDKSTDSTLDILQQYAAQDSRIQVQCNKSNRGVSFSRNIGLQYAHGEYVGFVDPDDYVDFDFYEKLYNAAIKTNSDIAKGAFQSHDAVNMHVGLSVLNKNIEQNAFYFATEHQSAIFRTDFLNKYTLRYPIDLITGEDSVFLSMVCIYNPTIVCVDDAVYHYIYHRAGSLDSVVFSNKKVLSCIKMLDYKIDILQKTRFNNPEDIFVFETKHILSNFMYVFAKNFESQHDKQRLFMWLRLNVAHFSLPALRAVFTRRKLKTIYNSDYFLFCHPEFSEIFYKKRCDNGLREIYVFGKKIFSYTKKKSFRFTCNLI